MYSKIVRRFLIFVLIYIGFFLIYPQNILAGPSDTCSFTQYPTEPKEGVNLESIRISNFPQESEFTNFYIALYSAGGGQGSCTVDPVSKSLDGIADYCKTDLKWVQDQLSFIQFDNDPNNDFLKDNGNIGGLANVKEGLYDLYLCGEFGGRNCQVQCKTSNYKVLAADGAEPEPPDPGGGGSDQTCTIKDSERTACQANSSGWFKGSCGTNLYCETRAAVGSFTPVTCYEGICQALPDSIFGSDLSDNKCTKCPSGSTWDAQDSQCENSSGTKVTREYLAYCEDGETCKDGEGVCETGTAPTNSPLSAPCDITKPGQWTDKEGCKQIRTAIGPISTDPNDFVRWILGFVLGISGGILILLLIVNGYKLMTSQGDPEKTKDARDGIIAAIAGLLLVIFSIVLLQLITVNVLGLPGFGG